MNGDITLNPVTIGTRTLDTSTQIMAPSQQAADAVNVQFYADSDSFSLVFPFDFWNCPQEVVTASLLDSALLIAPIRLDLESLTGNVVVGNFNRLNFNQARMRAYSSKITLGQIDIQGLLDLVTNNNDITLTSVTATQSQISNAQAAISLQGFSTASATINNVGGAITGSTFTILNSATCTISLSATKSPISFDSMVFPASGSCEVTIRTTSANVTLTTSLFSGSFDISTTGNGVVTIPSSSCGPSTSSCSGTVGLGSHRLVVQTTAQNVYVKLL